MDLKYSLNKCSTNKVNSIYYKNSLKPKGNTVKRSDVKSILSKLHIPKDSYSIDDIEDESLCLILDEGVWCVFYSERGNRAEAEYFANENDACEVFLT